jgi:hypothetical protein
MNIFYINHDPILSARELADEHILKMQIESAQMLCTTFWHFGISAPYKKAHYNHPSTKWVRESIHHFDWLLTHGLEICEEFKLRYGKEHATKKVLEWVKDNKFKLNGLIPTTSFKAPPCCMPTEYILKEDVVSSYRNFYIKDKVGVKKLNWRKIPNKKPNWI